MPSTSISKGLFLGGIFLWTGLLTCETRKLATPVRVVDQFSQPSRDWKSATSSSWGRSIPKSMGATYLDEKGKEVLFIMGCYGIGINRIVAAAVEAGHDGNGIIWPLSLAPYHVEVIPLQVQNAAVIEQSLALEKSLTEAGLDVLVDDRDQRPGFKFKDADLIGIPLRVVVGERGLKEGTVEIKWRAQAEAKLIPAASAASAILAEIAEARERVEASCLERRQARAASTGK